MSGVDNQMVNNQRVRRTKAKETPTIHIDSGRIKRRILISKVSRYVFLATVLFAFVVLAILLYNVIRDSIGWLDIEFLTGNLSMSADKAGIRGVIKGTVMLMLIVIPTTLVLGVSTAIYLEEYAAKGRIANIIRVNISNLASVPSVIFGLLGLTVFARFLGLGNSILAGGFTMSLLVLPIVVVASQEAIRAVPGFLRDASYAMGAGKWTTIRKVVLPVALPGILTGSILAMSRAIGETAPLVVLGVPALILRIPDTFMDSFTALPIQIYYWTLDSVLVDEYTNLAAATIVVMLLVLFLLNGAAIMIRNKFSKKF